MPRTLRLTQILHFKNTLRIIYKRYGIKMLIRKYILVNSFHSRKKKKKKTDEIQIFMCVCVFVEKRTMKQMSLGRVKKIS